MWNQYSWYLPSHLSDYKTVNSNSCRFHRSAFTFPAKLSAHRETRVVNLSNVSSCRERLKLRQVHPHQRWLLGPPLQHCPHSALLIGQMICGWLVGRNASSTQVGEVISHQSTSFADHRKPTNCPRWSFSGIVTNGQGLSSDIVSRLDDKVGAS